VTRVLVVEDSEPLGRMLAQTLTRAGLDAAWASTGAAAMQLAAATPPDVVLLDLHLGDMTGDELADALRAAVPQARLIGVSGAAPDRYTADQFDAFLLKPVALDALLGVVTNG
jgi:two-component system response regulator RegA